MFLSIDFAAVRNHLAILREEEKTARALEDSLEDWRRLALAARLPEAGQIENYLAVVQRQLCSIQDRIRFLEDALDTLAQTKRSVGGLLEDAVGLLGSSDNWYDEVLP